LIVQNETNDGDVIAFSTNPEDFIAWLAEHADDTVGLANHLMFAGPVACWLRSIGYTDVIVTREAVMGTYRTDFVLFGAPIPEWQLILSAEDSFTRGIAGDGGIITGRGMLDRLEEFGYN